MPETQEEEHRNSGKPTGAFLPASIPFVTRQACPRTPGLLGSLSEKLQPAFEETEPWTV